MNLDSNCWQCVWETKENQPFLLEYNGELGQISLFTNDLKLFGAEDTTIRESQNLSNEVGKQCDSIL